MPPDDNKLHRLHPEDNELLNNIIRSLTAASDSMIKLQDTCKRLALGQAVMAEKLAVLQGRVEALEHGHKDEQFGDAEDEAF